VPGGGEAQRFARMILVTLLRVDPGSLPSPLELLDLRFARTALAELILLALAGGLLGAFVVVRRLAFFAHAVGTATFPALVVADATGISATLAGMAAAAAYAGGVERAGRSSRDPGDSATGLLLVAALGGGVLLASDLFESGAAVDRLLFGTAIGLDGGDLALSGAAAALAVAATILFGRTWAAVGFDPDSAGALGLPVRRADVLLLGSVALAAVAALPAVGALLVSSLFVVPAAVARLFARDIRVLLIAAVGVALALAVVGLYLSLWLDVAPGPAVAVLGAGTYAACAIVSGLRAGGRGPVTETA
jgi:ABC-type Mn2+/Zn2+ transport system permease subunit